MKIVVPVKQVVSRDAQVRVDAVGTWVRHDTVSWALNEPDAYALEASLRLKDAHGAEVVAVTVGPERASQVLRECLARGADRAVHVVVDDTAIADPAVVAALLADAIRDEVAELVLTGLQSDDQGFAQVGLILAEHLGAAHATIVMEIAIDAGSVRVKRELEGGWFQWVGLPLPAVLTVQSGINQLRYATLRGIMAAKKKEVRVVTPAAIPPSRQRIVAVTVPERSRGTRMIAGSPDAAARELVRVLREELHVID